jgi:RNA polymerase primary sigma factor
MPRLPSQLARSAQSPLETYLHEINETPLLKADEERAIGYRIEEGDSEARDHLVRANLRLVVSIARSYQGNGLPLQDLIAEGNLGLVRAVEGYDPSLNNRFSTYASYWIKQSVQRAVINTAKTVRLPAYAAQLLTEWRRVAARLQDELGRAATDEETALRMKLTQKKRDIVKKAILVYNSAPQCGQSDSELSLGDTLKDDNTQAPNVDMAKADDWRQVLGLLSKMDEREALVLRLRFGLEDEEPMTLKDIGVRLGLTRERIRQIEKDALGTLREQLAARADGGAPIAQLGGVE